jgi:hypothetical protein
MLSRASFRAKQVRADLLLVDQLTPTLDTHQAARGALARPSAEQPSGRPARKPHALNIGSDGRRHIAGDLQSIAPAFDEVRREVTRC